MSETTTADAATTDAPDTGAEPGQDWKAEAEKFKALARKHEDRAKANASAASELDKLKAATLTETERAVAEAKAAGKAEAFSETRSELALAKLQAAAAGRIPDGIISALDPRRFITTDGDIDADAIAKFVTDNSPEPTDPADDKPSFTDFGQGKRPTAGLNSSQLESDIRAALGVS